MFNRCEDCNRQEATELHSLYDGVCPRCWQTRAEQAEAERDELEAWKAKYENENMALKLKLKRAEELLERAWWAGHNEGYRTTFEEWKSQTGGEG